MKIQLQIELHVRDGVEYLDVYEIPESGDCGLFVRAALSPAEVYATSREIAIRRLRGRALRMWNDNRHRHVEEVSCSDS